MNGVKNAARASAIALFTGGNAVRESVVHARDELRDSAAENLTTIVRTLCVSGENVAKTTARAARDWGTISAEAWSDVPFVGGVAGFATNTSGRIVSMVSNGIAAGFETMDIVLHYARTETKRPANDR